MNLKVTGKITDESNQPLSGAKVSLFDDDIEVHSEPSAANGTFEFTRQVESDSHAWTLIVKKEGFAPLQREIPLQEEIALELVLKRLVPPERIVAGVIVNEDNQPVSGARVALCRGEAQFKNDYSGDRGEFELKWEDQHKGATYTLVVIKEPFKKLKYDFPPGNHRDLRLVLHKMPVNGPALDWRKLAKIALLPALLFVAGLLIWVFAKPKGILVPAVTEMSLQEAHKVLYQRGLRYEIQQKAASPGRQPGTVWDAVPPSGSRVPPRRVILLIVDPGVQIPKIKNSKTPDDALGPLEKAGLKGICVWSNAPSTSIPVGAIWAVSPKEGSFIREKSSVTIFVQPSRGREVTYAGRTLPGDEIRTFRVLSVEPIKGDRYGYVWKLSIEVIYTHNLRHRGVSVGAGLLPLGQDTSKDFGYGTTSMIRPEEQIVETPAGRVFQKKQRVEINVRMNVPSYQTTELRLHLRDGDGESGIFLTKTFPFLRLWTRPPDVK